MIQPEIEKQGEVNIPNTELLINIRKEISETFDLIKNVYPKLLKDSIALPLVHESVSKIQEQFRILNLFENEASIYLSTGLIRLYIQYIKLMLKDYKSPPNPVFTLKEIQSCRGKKISFFNPSLFG